MLQGSAMLQKKKPNELVDSRLNRNCMEREAECMMHAAYLCISPHPEQRPRMSQVLYPSLDFSAHFLTDYYILKILSTIFVIFGPQILTKLYLMDRY